MERKMLFAASTWSHIQNFHLPYLRHFQGLGWRVHAACGDAPASAPYTERVLEVPFTKSMGSPRNFRAAALLRELIREEGRCMCLLLDDQESGIYRLIADREVYMTVDTKELERTVFHGQRVEGYVVFPEPAPEAVRRELPLLLARLDRRDDVLSPTRRMGVWSGEVPMTNTEAAKRQHQENRKIWCLE